MFEILLKWALNTNKSICQLIYTVESRSVKLSTFFWSPVLNLVLFSKNVFIKNVCQNAILLNFYSIHCGMFTGFNLVLIIVVNERIRTNVSSQKEISKMSPSLHTFAICTTPVTSTVTGWNRVGDHTSSTVGTILYTIIWIQTKIQ